MRSVTKPQVFWLSTLIGLILVVAGFGYDDWSSRPPQSPLNRLVADIWVSEQLHLDAIANLRARGFRTLIDLRPDGEAPDQPPASEVESAALGNNMRFFYVPVPHGDIPEEAVTALAKALANSPKPVLLYCRSGRRAARTWSLVEAARPNGLDANAIQAAVKAAGQSVDDLNAVILQRISHRSPDSGGS
jgi:uncharacterized protein (TIGR01244 family)